MTLQPMSVAKRDGACILMPFLTQLEVDVLELASLAFLLCLLFQVTVATQASMTV